MSISLIANSGIQFHKFELTIDPNEDITRSLRFYEWYDAKTFTVRLEYAHYLSEQDVWVSKRSLFQEGFINENGTVSEDLNLDLLNELTPDEDCFSINDIETPLDYFENKWIPLPFFELNNSNNSLFKPTNWCRLKLTPAGKIGAKRKYNATLAFDTGVNHQEESDERPFFHGNDRSINFGLCKDEQLLLDFCSEKYGCEWVDDYIVQLIHEDKSNIPVEFPSLKYLAYYIFFLHYLEKKEAFPEVKLYTDKDAQFADVDLVLDIGNSRTCGLLFDLAEPKDDPFSKVKKLILQDISDPTNSYSDPFSMRLAFHKADFGEMGFQSKQFVWPSILRVGEEANRLIYKSKNNNVDGSEKITNHSSPKRYLWDKKQSKVQWEFIDLVGTNPIRSIYLEGISEQFESDGSFNSTSDFGSMSSYSRKSLMTFVFLEIFAHAHTQINSFEFRNEHGNFSTPRRIKRVVITCPTAMPQEEQITLRKCAQEARIALKRFYENSYFETFDLKKNERQIQIIPSLKDLGLKLPDLHDKKDWGFDEATCCQLVFLYAEISRRYLNNCKEYFDLYGKVRADLGDYNKKSLTIGSIDIGAGTTDLMICSYQYEDAGKAVLTPVPLFWESFYYAGDDLLKEIVQQVIIEGRLENEQYRGSKGVIQNRMIEMGINNVEERLNTFFGEDTNLMNFHARKRRKDFNVQISIPIALNFLELARRNKEDHTLNYEELFPKNKPNKALLDSFFDHFGFRFEELTWKFSLKRINEIIITLFEPLLKKLSSLLYAYGCDFVLLAGKPTSLKQVEKLFLKFYPVSPDRIISLNQYRVGKWYPFQDGNGYFEDQKSLVAVGAMIGLLGSSIDLLDKFRFNMDKMKRKMLSSAKYFGIYDIYTKNISNAVLSPEVSRNTLKVAGVPVMVGCKQLDTVAYPSRPMYIFDFNDAKIKQKIALQRGIEDQAILQDELDRYKQNLKNKMPFEVKLSREFRTDREQIFIDSIVDKNRETVSSSAFTFTLQTLPNERGYWLDTGEFVLSIRERLS